MIEVLFLIIKVPLSILMILVGSRELSLRFSHKRNIIGVFLVFCGVLGYISSFF